MCGVFGCGKSEGADILAQHTLLQVCQPLSSVLEKDTTKIAWSGVWECCGEEMIDVRLKQGCGGCSVVEIVKVQIL